MMTTTTLTAQQANALRTLASMEPFQVTPSRTGRSRQTRRTFVVPAIIETGLNTQTLGNLLQAGLISAEHIWLSGHTTPDLAITEAGREALAGLK
jgi:hypothetical protein